MIKGQPGFALAYFYRGQCHQDLGNPDAALADYETFLKLAPGGPLQTLATKRIEELRR